MKRIKLLFLCILPLFAGGCVPHVELSEKAIVEAVAIDKDGGRYTVTVQYFGTEGAGGSTPVDSSKPNAITVRGSGETVAEAMTAVSANCGSPLMLGAAQFVLIGREATKEKLSELVNFVISYNRCHPQITLAAADGKASDILEVKFREHVSSPMKLASVFRNSKNLGMMYDSSFISVVNGIYSRSGSTVLPLVKVSEGLTDMAEEDKSVSADGAVLYRDGTALADISSEEVSGLMLLGGGITELPVKMKAEGKNVSLNVYGVTVRITSSAGEKNNILFAVEVSAAAQITDNTLVGTTHETYPVIEKAAAGELTELVKKAAENVIKKHGADPTGLESIVRNADPHLWREAERDWQKALENSEWLISSEVRIERYGTYME